MKILSGEFRGHRIPFKAKPELRPTPDKVRQAIMQVMADAIEGATVLDLFAGTGALGLEALSNGASHATFVDKSRPLCAALEKTARELKLNDRVRVVPLDFEEALMRFDLAEERFNLIFSDPPYKTGVNLGLLASLSDRSVLRPGGWVVIETNRKEVLPDRAGDIRCVKKSSYGDTAVAYYRLKQANST